MKIQQLIPQENVYNEDDLMQELYEVAEEREQQEEDRYYDEMVHVEQCHIGW